MNKKLSILLVVLMLALSFAGCSKPSQETAQPTAQPAADEPVTLNFMLNSPELTDQYNDMVEAYKKAKPNVTINLQILQNDYQTVLKTKLNSGDAPDLFMSSAYNDNKVFKDYAYNLDNEDFMKDIDPAMLVSTTLDGHLTGYPFLVQSHSFIYNKDLFSKAGITTLPATFDEYKQACEKLKAIGVQPFSSGFAEWWVLPQTTYPAMSDANGGDYVGLFKSIESGSQKFGDLPQVDYALDFIDLIKENSGNKPMESTFDVQVSDLANGKAAIIHQGTWAEDSIKKINPDINIGFINTPRSDGKSVLAVESNLTFRVYKDSKNLKDVLDWLRWITTSDYGKSWIPEKIKQISPQVGAKMPDTMLAKETGTAIANKATSPWWIFIGPDGIEQPLGVAFQNYAAGSGRQETKDALTKIFVDAYNAQKNK
ncbi:MAG: hypothetical protein APF77_19510 [Clostridia bacterium BRH_c25]|nr:MAG: hypothetical protein APF77_19510 [Clostridia bacterium BRH_c25]